jgi:hypothetical protein
VIVGPIPHRPRGSSLVRERPAGRAVTAAAVGRVGTRVTDRGPAWPCRHADTTVFWAPGRGR